MGDLQFEVLRLCRGPPAAATVVRDLRISDQYGLTGCMGGAGSIMLTGSI